MLLALLALASMADWVPARWISGDPHSLDLVTATPVNCLLLEQEQWTPQFAPQAAAHGIATLGIIHPDRQPLEAIRKARSYELSGIAAEGVFAASELEALRAAAVGAKLPLIEITTRNRMRFGSDAPVLATFQGLWPGVEAQDDKGETKAGPSAAPWINTNTGFLRFVHAAAPDSVAWIANLPPPGRVITRTQYAQAIGDAALSGARWVVALDSGLAKRLLARDATALSDWQTLAALLRFYEEHKDWRSLRPHSELALVEDKSDGALLSGGVLDMIAVKHTPVRPVPASKLSPPALEGAKMAVDIDSSTLSSEGKQILKTFTRSGGTLLTGPPGWHFETLGGDEITLGKKDLDRLDEIWKEMNSMTGRKNLGARLFNVASMLSNLLETANGQGLVLQLVNYSDFPVEDMTAQVLGSWKHARLYRPDAAPQDLATYPVEEGTGIDIPKLATAGTLVLN